MRSSQLRRWQRQPRGTRRCRSPFSSTISAPEVGATSSAADQCSCMALHRACPVQRSNAASLDARTRSVWGRPCPGASPSCPMQELSRTPQTRPINDKPPTQTCLHQRPVRMQRGAKNAGTWWRGYLAKRDTRSSAVANPLAAAPCICSRRALHYSTSALRGASPQKRLAATNASATFGFAHADPCSTQGQFIFLTV